MSEYVIKIKENGANEREWRTVSPQSVYDAIHTVAGALLGGAMEVKVRREA